jgi:hypothetical protein
MIVRFCFLGLLFLFFNTSVAQNSYLHDMKKNIQLLDSAIKKQEISKLARNFSQLSSQYQKQWLPSYYEAFCYLMIALEKKGKQADEWCDKAELIFIKLDSIEKNNSEILVLKSLMAAARINVNQAARGQKYGAQSVKYADKAIQLSQNNPRAYLQKATAVFYTPEAFGGGAKKAKPIIEISIEKYKTFKPSTAIEPDWGEERAKELLKEINRKAKQKDLEKNKTNSKQ